MLASLLRILRATPEEQATKIFKGKILLLPKIFENQIFKNYQIVLIYHKILKNLIRNRRCHESNTFKQIWKP